MKVALSALLISLAAIPSAFADTLLLDAIEAREQAIPGAAARPARGASMARVLDRFGEPSSTRPAVGEPPITRWAYPGYTVYFEYDKVIDVVIDR